MVSALDREVQVRALAGSLVLCSWAPRRKSGNARESARTQHFAMYLRHKMCVYKTKQNKKKNVSLVFQRVMKG